jgi:hypothetical protein
MGERQHALALLGEAAVALAPLHDYDFHFYFELPQGGRECRLGNVASRSGAREMFLPGECDQIRKLPDKHYLLDFGSAISLRKPCPVRSAVKVSRVSRFPECV